MSHRMASPVSGEFVSVSLNTPFLLVGNRLEESTSIILSAGQVPTGAASFCVHFGGTDYGREMSDAVLSVVNEINEKWGLTKNWSPKARRFTGMAAEPFVDL